MVENTVDDNLDAVFMQLAADFPEIVIASQPRINAKIVAGVVSVVGGLKNRSQI